MKEDRYIWEEFKNGEEGALSCIYHQNIDFLFCYGKKFAKNEELILDVIQDLFYELIKSRKNLGMTDNIRLYLLKSFRRKLFKELNHNKINTDLIEGFAAESHTEFSIEEVLILFEEQSRRIQFIKQGILELSSKQQEILYYKFTCNYDYPQICDIMSITHESARQLVSRAIRSMKKYIADNDFVFMFIFRSLAR